MLNKAKEASISLFQLVGKFRPTFLKYRPKLLIGILLIFLATAIDLLVPLLVGKIVDAVASKQSLERINTLCLYFGALVLGSFVFNACKGFVIQSTGQKIVHELRLQLFEHVLRLPVTYFDKNPAGRPLTRVINDIKTIGEIFSASLSVIVLDLLIITGTIITMLWLNFKLAAVVLLVFPLIVITVSWFNLRIQETYRKARFYLSEMNAFLGENIGAIATIQRLAAQKSRYDRFSGIVENHFKAQMDNLRFYALIQPLTNFYNGIGLFSLIALGGYWVSKGEMTVGTLVAFLGYIRNLFQPIRDLVEKYNLLLSAKISAERVNELLNQPTETTKADFNPRQVISPSPITIEFRNVSFSYPGQQRRALQEVSFHVEAGKSIAIVGPTGGGKSSLVRLLLRFYENQYGEIFINGKLLSDWPKNFLRSHIGIVQQEIYLIRGTVRENLTLGSMEFHDDYLIEQCKKAQAWDFLLDTGGLDTLILEGGSNFSQGERQLLSFARILCFNPPLFIFDEATAHIDRAIEGRLMAAVDAVLRSRTSLVIAHRLSTIESCDKILVVENGKITQQGSFASLSLEDGLFKSLQEIGEVGNPT